MPETLGLTPQQAEWRATHKRLRSSSRWSASSQALLDSARSFVPPGEAMETAHMLLAALDMASTDRAVAQRLSQEEWYVSTDQRLGAMQRLMDLPFVRMDAGTTAMVPIANRSAAVLEEALALRRRGPIEPIDIVERLLAGGGIGIAEARRQVGRSPFRGA